LMRGRIRGRISGNDVERIETDAAFPTPALMTAFSL